MKENSVSKEIITDVQINTLVSTVRRLRGGSGCPWDKKQTVLSLLKYLKSEVAELVAAVENEDSENICEELGDILYIIVMMTEICWEQHQFGLDQVLATVNSKMIRRHPHVFEGKPYSSEEELHAQWQAIKAEEKKK